MILRHLTFSLIFSGMLIILWFLFSFSHFFLKISSFQPMTAWIGMSDNRTKGVFRWFDGTVPSSFELAFTQATTLDICVAANLSYKGCTYLALDCETPLEFICQNVTDMSKLTDIWPHTHAIFVCFQGFVVTIWCHVYCTLKQCFFLPPHSPLGNCSESEGCLNSWEGTCTSELYSNCDHTQESHYIWSLLCISIIVVQLRYIHTIYMYFGDYKSGLFMQIGWKVCILNLLP